MNIILFRFSFSILMIPTIVCPCSARAEEGWVINQITQQNGSFEVSLTRRGWKFCNKQKGYSVIATGSSLLLLNDRTMKFFKTTIEGTHLQFLTRSVEGAMNKPKDEHPILIPKTKRIAGMDTLTYRANLTGTRRVNKTIDFVQSTYRVAKEIKVSPSLRKSIATNLLVPEDIMTYYPLEAQYRRRDGKSKLVLETYAVRRKQLPQNAFSIPNGYRQAKSEGELFVDENSEELIKSLID